jgi:hypothetical protein
MPSANVEARAGISGGVAENLFVRNGWPWAMPGGLPLKRSVHAAPMTVTARLRRRGRWPWSDPCRKGILVRRIENGSVEPFPA